MTPTLVASRRLLMVAAVGNAAYYATVMPEALGPAGLPTPWPAPLDGMPRLPEGLVPVVLAAWVGLAVLTALAHQERVWRGAGAALLGLVGYVLVLDQQTYSNGLYCFWTALLIHVLWPPEVALHLLRWQLSIVYGFAALWKVNLPWLLGIPLAMHLTGPAAPPGAWRNPLVFLALAVITIAVEAWLAVALWRPAWRRTAWLVGGAMHAGMVLGIGSGTIGLVAFALTMFSLYLAHGWPLPSAAESRGYDPTIASDAAVSEAR